MKKSASIYLSKPCHRKICVVRRPIRVTSRKPVELECPLPSGEEPAIAPLPSRGWPAGELFTYIGSIVAKPFWTAKRIRSRS